MIKYVKEKFVFSFFNDKFKIISYTDNELVIEVLQNSIYTEMYFDVGSILECHKENGRDNYECWRIEDTPLCLIFNPYDESLCPTIIYRDNSELISI
jgi:hypothetical protein